MWAFTKNGQHSRPCLISVFLQRSISNPRIKYFYSSAFFDCCFVLPRTVLIFMQLFYFVQVLAWSKKQTSSVVRTFSRESQVLSCLIFWRIIVLMIHFFTRASNVPSLDPYVFFCVAFFEWKFTGRAASFQHLDIKTWPRTRLRQSAKNRTMRSLRHHQNLTPLPCLNGSCNAPNSPRKRAFL